MKAIARIATIAGLAAVLAAGALSAQAPGIKRSILQRIDLGNGMEVVMGLAEIAPGASAGRHTHFGIETGYALAGRSSLEIEGETPRLLNPGDSFVIPSGKVHDAKTVGDAPAKVLAVWVVEKGKPLGTPAR